MNLSGKLIPPESAYDKIEEGQPVAEELSMFIPAPVFTSITSKHVFSHLVTADGRKFLPSAFLYHGPVSLMVGRQREEIW